MADAAVETGGSDGFVSEFDTEVQGQDSGTSSSNDTGGTGAPASAPTSPAEAALGTATQRAPARTAPAPQAQPQPNQPPVDLVALLEKQLAEEMGGPKPAPRANPEQELQKLLEGVTQPGAQERIRTLANARTQANQQLAEVTRQFNEVQQYIPQVQQWAQAEIQKVSAAKDQELNTLRGQLQALTANFEAMKAMAPQKPEDPVDQLQKSWMDKLSERDQQMREQWEKEHLSPLQERLDAIEKAKKDQELKADAENYRTTARQAAEAHVLRGLQVPEQWKNTLLSGLGAEIIAHQMHTGSTPEQAAAAIRQKHMMMATLFTRAASTGFKPAQQAAREVPTATNTRRNAGLGSPMPSLQEIHKLGYTDELDFLAAQDKAQGL